MKKTNFLMLFTLLIISKIGFGDIITTPSHWVPRCVHLTNIEKFPKLSFLCYGNVSFNKYEACLINPNECLAKDSELQNFKIYAVKSEYLIGKEIKSLTLEKNPNAIGYQDYFRQGYNYPDSEPIISIEEYYKIQGFFQTNLVLFKWKEIIKFNNGKEDSITIFEDDCEDCTFSQQIPVGIDASSNISKIQLYPNPVKKNLNLKISNGHKGKIEVQIVSLEGKLMRTLFLYKTGAIFNYEIPVGNMPKGDYIAKFEYGKQMETKQFMVE